MGQYYFFQNYPVWGVNICRMPMQPVLLSEANLRRIIELELQMKESGKMYFYPQMTGTSGDEVFCDSGDKEEVLVNNYVLEVEGLLMCTMGKPEWYKYELEQFRDSVEGRRKIIYLNPEMETEEYYHKKIRDAEKVIEKFSLILEIAVDYNKHIYRGRNGFWV